MRLSQARSREQTVYNLKKEQGRQDLEIVANETDLGVIMTNDLKSFMQCA